MFTESIDEIFLIIGLIFIVYTSTQAFFYSIRLIKRQFSPNLLKKYGENSWVVITGSSDGIGRSYAEKLAERGFNIVLVARNKTKLENVASEIKKLNDKVKVRIVVADFTKSSEPGFIDKIYDEIKDLDVSVLVNNVGLFVMLPFHQIEESELKNMLAVNLYPVVLLTRKFINQLKGRKYKSAIINLSSTSRLQPAPFAGVYGATKNFIAHFSESLAIEYPDIDILSVGPHFVTSPMTFEKDNFETITPDQVAEGSLRELGRYSMSACHIKHDFITLALRSLNPNMIINKLFTKFYLGKEIDRREEIKGDLKKKKI